MSENAVEFHTVGLTPISTMRTWWSLSKTNEAMALAPDVSKVYFWSW